MSRVKREKASDVLARTNFWLGKLSTFDQAFPTIKELRVVVVEDGDGITEWNHERHYTQRDLGEYVDCHNPRCYNGGVSVGTALRRMAAERETETQCTARCQGYEGSPKGRKNYGPCFNMFDVKITVTYR